MCGKGQLRVATDGPGSVLDFRRAEIRLNPPKTWEHVKLVLLAICWGKKLFGFYNSRDIASYLARINV